MTRNGATALCAKCGSDDIHTRYHPDDGIHGCSVTTQHRFSYCDMPHLHMSCRSCRWDWCEETYNSRQQEGK